MKNEIVLLDEEEIKSKIYNIRGKEVMLDSDLAKLYRCKYGTKDINKAVKRNINKFPDDFYFQLTEVECLRFQNGTLNKSGNLRGQHIKYLPHVFTEEGVAMLSSVLKTNIANEVSVKIMRAFVAMRHILMNNLDYHKELSIIQNKVLEHDNKFIEYDEKISSIIDSFSTDDILKEKIIFKGSFYDAYSLLLDIFNNAKEEILIIDNYVDNKVLNMTSKLNIKVTIVSSNMNNELINKYQKQYNNLTIISDDSFHDRFIIIDKETGYHLGSSIKDIGKKISYIDTIDKRWVDVILKEIKK